MTSSDHRTIESAVSPPTMPAAVDTHALAMAREKAVSKTTDRAIIIQSCAVEVERFCSRVFFRGPVGAARTAEAIVAIMDPSRPVSVCPVRPNVSGVVVSGVEVAVWDDAAADWTTPSPAHTVRPAGRVLIHAAGEYRVRCALLPADPVPDPIVEAIGRMFAMREQLRPGDTTIEGPMNLAGVLIRSGAGEILLSWRTPTM